MVEKINLYHSLPSASPNNIPCFPSPLVLFFPLNFKDTKHCLALNKIYISSYQTGWASCQCFFLTVEMPFFFFYHFHPFFLIGNFWNYYVLQKCTQIPNKQTVDLSQSMSCGMTTEIKKLKNAVTWEYHVLFTLSNNFSFLQR